MGVDHGGFDLFATQQFLHGADVIAVFQQMRGKRMVNSKALSAWFWVDEEILPSFCQVSEEGFDLRSAHFSRAAFIVFVISWGGILLVIGAFGGIPATKEQFDTQLPIAILAMLGGPSAAGLLLTGLVYGKAGFRELLARLFRWRVGVGWNL